MNGEAITRDELLEAVRTATLTGTLVPVLCGSSLKNQGVQPLLDAVINFLPSPVDIPSIQGTLPNGAPAKRTKNKAAEPDKITRPADDTTPFSALAFKVASHPTVDKLVYCRVYSGTLKRGEAIYNVRSEKQERVNRILQMHANKEAVSDAAYAGDIVALVGL